MKDLVCMSAFCSVQQKIIGHCTGSCKEMLKLTCCYIFIPLQYDFILNILLNFGFHTFLIIKYYLKMFKHLHLEWLGRVKQSAIRHIMIYLH